MDENTKKLIQEQFKTLPDGVKKVISSINVEGVLNTLTEGHPLEIHQRIAIENEIMLVLLRLEDFSSFTTNIRHGAQISRERAERITKSINREIFIPNQAVLNIKTLQKEIHRPVSSSQTITANHKDEITEKQESNNILQDKPQDSKPKDIDIFHKKLTQQVHIPKEEERINLEEKEVQEKPKQDTPPTDPYREPID